MNEWCASAKQWNLHPHCARAANHKQTLPQWYQPTLLHSVHDYMFRFTKFITTVTFRPSAPPPKKGGGAIFQHRIRQNPTNRSMSIMDLFAISVQLCHTISSVRSWYSRLTRCKLYNISTACVVPESCNIYVYKYNTIFLHKNLTLGGIWFVTRSNPVMKHTIMQWISIFMFICSRSKEFIVLNTHLMSGYLSPIFHHLLLPAY